MYFVDGDLPAHGLLAAGENHHRLGLAVQQRRDVLAEVLDDDLDLLADVVGMETHPSHDAFQRGVALDLLVVPFSAAGGQTKGKPVRRVVLEHIEDEAFLNRLPHRIDMEGLREVVGTRWLVWIWPTTKEFQRLGFRGGREGDIGDALSRRRGPPFERPARLRC